MDGQDDSRYSEGADEGQAGDFDGSDDEQNLCATKFSLGTIEQENSQSEDEDDDEDNDDDDAAEWECKICGKKNNVQARLPWGSRWKPPFSWEATFVYHDLPLLW